MMATVRSVTASSMRAGLMFSVARSTSTKAGVNPAWSTALPVATKESEGTMTSSPRSAPKSYSAASARASASPPLDTATASRAPVSSAKRCSNSRTIFPLETRPLSSAARTRFFASSVIVIVPKGIFMGRLFWPPLEAQTLP